MAANVEPLVTVSDLDFMPEDGWLIDLQNRVIEVLVIKGRILEPGATYKENEEIRTPVLPGFVCKVSDVFSM